MRIVAGLGFTLLPDLPVFYLQDNLLLEKVRGREEDCEVLVLLSDVISSR